MLLEINPTRQISHPKAQLEDKMALKSLVKRGCLTSFRMPVCLHVSASDDLLANVRWHLLMMPNNLSKNSQTTLLDSLFGINILSFFL